MGLDPLRSIGEGVFENVGKQLSKGVGSSMQDSLGVDMKSFTQIASNSVLRYFGVGKKAQKDPKNNKSKIKSIVEDAIKDYVSAVDKGSGTIRGELDDVDLSSVDAIARNSLLRYFGVGRKAQSDPKNNRAKIKSIIEDAVQQYSGTEVKKENSGVISSTFSEINKAFSETVNKGVQGIAERAKLATIKEVRRASTNVLANSSSGARDSVNGLFDAAESGRKGSVGQYIGRGLASQSRKAVEGTFSSLFPTVAPIVKEFLATGNKPPVEKQAPKQRPADGLLEAANQLKEAAKAISESAIKVQSVAPVIYEQTADPWGGADLTPVQIPLKPAKQKTKKDEPEPELVLLELPQQAQQHFKTLNTEVGKNTAKSLEFLKATTQENIKQQTTQSIANIKTALAAINQYFKAEYKQVKDAVDNAKSTGHIDDINAARSAAKNYQRRSSGAIKEVDRIIKSGEEAGFSKDFGSELSDAHKDGKSQLAASNKRAGQQLGGLNLLETNQFKKDVKLYAELAKKAGIEIDAGLIKGLDIGSAGVTTEARDLLNGLVATVKKTMGIQSPSRVMIPLGMMIAAGLGLGIKNGVVDVSSAVGLLTDAIGDGLKDIQSIPSEGIEAYNQALENAVSDKSELTKKVFEEAKGASKATLPGMVLGTTMMGVANAGLVPKSIETPLRHLGAFYQGKAGVHQMNPQLAREAEIATIFNMMQSAEKGDGYFPDGGFVGMVKHKTLPTLAHTLGGFNYTQNKDKGLQINDVYDWHQDANTDKNTPFKLPKNLGSKIYKFLESKKWLQDLLGVEENLFGNTKAFTKYNKKTGRELFSVLNTQSGNDFQLGHSVHSELIGGNPYIQTHRLDGKGLDDLTDLATNPYIASKGNFGQFLNHPKIQEYVLGSSQQDQQPPGLIGQLLPALKKDLSNNPILTNLFSSATKAFGKGGSFKDIGTNLITSFGQGILSSDDGVFGILGTFAKSAIGLVKKIFGIASPSKVMQSIGLDFGKGFENGAVASLVLANKRIANLILKTVNESETATDLQKASAANYADRVTSQNENIAKKFREGKYNNSNAHKASNELAYSIDAGKRSAEYTGVDKAAIPKILQQAKRDANAVDLGMQRSRGLPTPMEMIAKQKMLSLPTPMEMIARRRTINGIPDPWSTPISKTVPSVLSNLQPRIYPITPDPWGSTTKPNPSQPNWVFHVPVTAANTSNNINRNVQIPQEIQQPIPVKFDPRKILGLTNDLANNVISAVGNSIRQTRMSGNATLGQFMRNAVVAAGSAMSGSLMGMLGGHLKTFFPMIMKVALPMAGVAALKLGDATTGNLLKNGIFKQGGFLTELLSAFSGVKLGSMGGAGIKSAIAGITQFLGVFPMLSPLARIGTMAANAGVVAHDVFSGGNGERKSVNSVLEDKTAENLKEAGLNSTGNSTADLVENLAETTVGALFRMIGFDGVKASAVQALIKGKVKKHSGRVANAVGGVGKGQVSALIDGYVKGDSTQLASAAESMLKNMGITGLDPKQIKLAANAITATLSGLHAKFGQEGFNLGNSISKGFKNSLNNLANAKDDLEYNLKKAVGKASAGDVIGNIFKRMSRGFVVDKGMFDEMWNQVGSAFKKGAFKGMSGNEQEGMFGNMMGFMASATAMFAPITTMAASLAPLFLPLMPIIAGIGGAIRMVMPQLSKLFEGIQRVETLQRRFTFLGGSKAGGIAELNYAKGVANQMNVPSEVAANAYSQLAIAARGTKMEGQGVKDLFEGITASLSALGLGGQDASLVFMAYTQILSKGKLSMEELRQQLGERFPPAMGVFAKAMGVSVSEMNDLVASGSILSQDILPKVAKVLKLDYGKAASGSADSLVLALTKLSNVGFEITTVFTDKLSGALAGVVNFASNGLGFLKDSLGTLIPLGQSFAIGFAATIAVGLSIMMTKIKPVVVLLGSLQSLLLSTFSAIASNLMPMIIGITSDVADGWLGAESDLMKNMYDGVNNMIVGLLSMVDSGARALSGKPLFAEGLIGGKSANLVVAGIDAIKGALSAVFSVIPPGVVELGALVFMFEQAIALGTMALGPALVGGGKALLGMVVGIKNAFIGTVGTVKIWGELMMTSMNAGAVATEKAAARAMIANEGWKMSLIALRSMATHVAIAMGILMFSKGDFSNPLGDKISETSKKVTVNLNNMKSAALSLGEAFDKAAGQLVNLNNKLTDTLPSKGVQLDIRNFWDKTKSTTSDDLIRNSNRAEVERRQREKDGKQTFGDKALNVADKALKYSGITTPMYLYNSWLSDRLVPKTDDATIDLVKKYGLEKYIAPDKNLRIDMAQSQVIKALQDSEANTKALASTYSKLGLTKETQQNYLIPEKMGPVGNSFDIDAQLKDVKDKLKELDKVRASLVVFNQRGSNLFTSPEQIESRKKDYGINSTALTSLGLNADADNVYDRDIEAQKNILAERIKQLESQRASTAQGVERFKSNKEIQLIDAQILDKVKRGVQLEKANPSDATRKELGGIDATVLELKTRREKIINGMGSDVKDNQEALDLLVQHKKDILDGADEATKAYSIQIRRVIAKNVDQQIELVKNALEIAQKSVPAQFGDDLYKNAANKLRDTQIAFDRTGSADKIASTNFRASVNNSSETAQRIAPILANKQVADLEKQQKELDNLTKVKKQTIDAYAAILRYGANKDIKDELEKLKAEVLKDDESLAQLQDDVATAKRGIRQTLVDQTKQVADYYRTAVREAQAVGIEFQKAQKTLENSRMQNKLREALIGAGDNIYTQFIEGIINIISQTSEIEKQQLEAKKQRIDYENNVQDIRLQASELQRSLPGKIIPLDSSIADNFNLSLEKIDGTVETINSSVKDVAGSLSKEAVEAAKKLADELEKTNGKIETAKTKTLSWIEAMEGGSKIFNVFENGFDGIGSKIANLQIQTATWLGSISNAPGLLQNAAIGVQSAVTGIFGEQAGQQLEQGAKQLGSDPLGTVKKFYGLDNLQTVNQTLLRPTPGRQTSGYGMRIHPIHGTRKMHNGVDFGDATGTPIKSPLTGTVITSKGGWNSGAGNMVEVETITAEGKKVINRFFHLSQLLKKVGDIVQQGDVVGRVGNTGDSTGAHLHWEVMINGQRLNPTTQLGKTFNVPGIKVDTSKQATQLQTKQRQPVPKVLPLPTELTDFVKQKEGFAPKAKWDYAQYSVGYGTKARSANESITREEADARLNTELEYAMQSVKKIVKVKLTNNQLSALTSLVYNAGSLTQFPKLLAAVNSGNFKEASNQFLDINKAGGKVLPGLTERRRQEAQMFMSRNLDNVVMQGNPIDPDSMQNVVYNGTLTKLNTAGQQRKINETNSNLSPEQIRGSQLQQTLERDKYLLQARTGARTFGISTKERSFGTEKFVAEGLIPNMSNIQQYIVKMDELVMNLNKRESDLLNIIENTPDPGKLPKIKTAFEEEMRPRFKDDPKGLSDLMVANDLRLNNAVNDRNAAIEELKLLRNSRAGIIESFQADFNKKELFRFKEQSISEQTKVIEQLQQQLQLVQKLDEIDPLDPLVLSIPALQRNNDLLSINRDQYQQLLDLQKRYYDGGGKGGNMSEEAFQKEFNAIINVNSVKREGVDLNFGYADTVRRIKYATDELTKAQTIRSSQMKSLQLDNERFAIDNKNGLVSIIGLTNELTMKTNELTNAYKKQLLEIEGDVLLNEPGDKLLARLRADRNYRQGLSNIGAEFESKKTEAELVTNPQVGLSRKEKLISSDNAIAAERIRGNELFGVRSRDMQKMQALSQINMDFEREKIEIERFGQANKDSAEEVQILLNNLDKLNKLKLDNLSKEFNISTEVISGIKGDMEGIFKSFILDNSSENTEGIQSVNKSLDDIKKKRIDTVMNTSDNIMGVGSSYKSPNTELLKYLDVAQKDLERKKDELNKRNIGEFFGEIGKSILNNLAGVVSKELSNQLFGSLTGFLFGKKKEDGSVALNTAGVNLQGSATSLQTSAMMLRDAAIAMNAGSAAKTGGGGILGSILSIFGGGTPTNSGLGADGSFIGDIIPNESYNMAFNGGMVGKLPTFANGGIVGAMNKERSITGRTPHLIVASEGERILNHRQTKRFEELQMEKVLNYAGGGVVGSSSTPNMNFTAPSQSSTVNINVPVNVNGGQGDASVNVPQLQNAVRSAVLMEIQKQQRPGGALGR
jgi:tape measure domain-containing protein